MKWNSSVDVSVAGKDYPEGKVNENEPKRCPLVDDERYKPYLEEYAIRHKYKNQISQNIKCRINRKTS